MRAMRASRRLPSTMLCTAPSVALPAAASTPSVDKGDSAWMLVATMLVMLMIVPGLALFYGGLVRAKNILSMLMQVVGAGAGAGAVGGVRLQPHVR